jgi:hypothetical protein
VDTIPSGVICGEKRRDSGAGFMTQTKAGFKTQDSRAGLKTQEQISRLKNAAVMEHQQGS